MLLTGRLVSADEGYRLGFVNEVVPAAELMAAAQRWASEILECSPLLVQLTKESAHDGFGLPVDEAIARDWERADPAAARVPGLRRGAEGVLRAAQAGLDGALIPMSLKLGLNTGFWASGAPSPAALEAVKEAERLGFDSIWTSEAYGCDVLTPLAWWGSQTEKVRLGTAIMQMSARRPTAAAMAAMTMDHLSGGRFILGLGVSGPQVVEGWYGEPFAKPLARTREYVSIVRDVIARQRARHLRRRRTTRCR